MMNAYKVGDEVGYVRYGSWGHTMMSQGISRIVKINHHGHIILENGKQFDKQGRERKKEYGGTHLIDAQLLRDQIAEDRATRERGQAAQALIKLMEQQKDGYGRYHKMSDEIKQEMILLINLL